MENNPYFPLASLLHAQPKCSPIATITELTDSVPLVGATEASMTAASLAVLPAHIIRLLSLLEAIVQTLVLLHRHRSGDNTSLRIGAEPSYSNETGMFHSTTAAETTIASHGSATNFCRLVFRSYQVSGPGGYYISTGLGKSEFRYGNYVVNDECFADTANSGWEYARCAHATTSKICPKGWGNQHDYNTLLPGCFEGSYYPHPTPASATDIYTGSLYSDKCIEPALINENRDSQIILDHQGKMENATHTDISVITACEKEIAGLYFKTMIIRNCVSVYSQLCRIIIKAMHHLTQIFMVVIQNKTPKQIITIVSEELLDCIKMVVDIHRATTTLVLQQLSQRTNIKIGRAFTEISKNAEHDRPNPPISAN